ncbi:N-glycosylase/DNA lyase [Phytophthora citrophthora]|uniref:DNA-(apurinic or apyrimidinic site) lyase n=1 Tax=Phytophthora citrophthora TaxID=4793 RepID=A0AAD9GA48_9STRA|nr:N-glycosylase/DNA lyase [Phytophthora citrophthora]
MTEIILRLRGMRIIRQDPVECLFSFICSSNNNIARIQGMVDKLKATYGDLIYTDAEEQQCFYEFPSVDTLAAKCEEATLRSLGFGYRAAFIVKTAKQLQELGGASYLLGIRDGKGSILPKAKKQKKNSDQDDEEASYHAYQDELMVFSGVGRKVADCVALFSLEKMEAIPVDTHVWQIACRELDATLSNRKSITPTVYQAVGDLFRTRFSPQAGWAHSVLFAGDLSAFKPKKTKAKQRTSKRKGQKGTTSA